MVIIVGVGVGVGVDVDVVASGAMNKSKELRKLISSMQLSVHYYDYRMD